MFGYVTADQDELKVKDLRKYREFYCGLCKDLKKRAGQSSRFFLTYDMTFLAILLSSLNEEEEKREKIFCIFHPFQKMYCIRNRYTAYAADMNVLLVYHNLMDDWLDEKKIRSRIAAGMIHRAYNRMARQYPQQVQAIEEYLEKLHEAEQENSRDLDLAAGLTGRLMAEIYCCTDDIWRNELRSLGFYLGKFIYLMDARDDVEEDRAENNYNPFLGMAEEEKFEERSREILVMMASEAAKAFERLPILENVDILRNILYSGIWNQYRKLQDHSGKLQNKKG